MTVHSTGLAGPAFYIPLLKGKLGELDALSHLDPAQLDNFRPLVEVIPTGLDEEDPQAIAHDVRRFAERLATKWTFGHALIVDLGYVAEETPLSGGLLPVQSLLRDLGQRGLTAVPVIRPSDSDVVREAAANAIAEFGGAGACIRLAGEDLDDEDAPFDSALTELINDVGVRPGDVDLILDLGAISEESSISLQARLARFVLGEIPLLDEWRTLTLAAGAFPADLRAVQAGVWGEVPRHEAVLWESVRERWNRRMPGFGDYGVAHPAVPQTAAFAPAPQIRYTTPAHWAILKGRKGVRRGSQQFYDICAALIQRSDYSGRDFSWGDQRIYDAAQSAPEGAAPVVGTGNATTWRTIGTSHHMALVLSRLTTQGAP